MCSGEEAKLFYQAKEDVSITECKPLIGKYERPAVIVNFVKERKGNLSIKQKKNSVKQTPGENIIL